MKRPSDPLRWVPEQVGPFTRCEEGGPVFCRVRQCRTQGCHIAGLRIEAELKLSDQRAAREPSVQHDGCMQIEAPYRTGDTVTLKNGDERYDVGTVIGYRLRPSVEIVVEWPSGEQDSYQLPSLRLV